MIKPFNMMNVNISCLGNHELELGLKNGKKLIEQTNCPWIMTNLFEISTGMKPIIGLPQYHILKD